MPTVDLSSYHQPAGTEADGTKFDNLIDAVQAALNGLDNNNIAALAGIDVSKIAAAYATYTPTWTASGTAPAIGNATVVARYLQIGKLVHAYGVITFGSTSTFGTGTYSFALPVTASANVSTNNAEIGCATLFDTSATALFSGAGAVALTAATMGVHLGATYLGTLANVGQTVPWTWATGDQVKWNITYEAA